MKQIMNWVIAATLTISGSTITAHLKKVE